MSGTNIYEDCYKYTQQMIENIHANQTAYQDKTQHHSSQYDKDNIVKYLTMELRVF